MRLWSLHPRYLDVKGLLAVWREGLLALAVLKGNTVGYKNHPQLCRFRTAKNPVDAVQCYLRHVYREAIERGYHFDSSKITQCKDLPPLIVTSGQLSYEFRHLKAKLKTRCPAMYRKIYKVANPQAHPLFEIIDGPIENWEKVPEGHGR